MGIVLPVQELAFRSHDITKISSEFKVLVKRILSIQS